MGVGMVGWWGCGSCGLKVPNDHRGPCPECRGQIRRMVPTDMAVAVELDAVPQFGTRLSTRVGTISPST